MSEARDPQPIARLSAHLAGRYRVDDELGSGGMAVVYRAHDLRHGRPVALKVLRPELAAALGPERFLREIRVAARLQHPNIVPLLDSGEVPAESGAGVVLWYAMPLVEGESLRTRLIREGAQKLDDALRWTRELADALAHAHQHGIVHRDIKPENILLTGAAETHALLADFGVARALETSADERLTETGLSLGTPAKDSVARSIRVKGYCRLGLWAMMHGDRAGVTRWLGKLREGRLTVTDVYNDDDRMVCADMLMAWAAVRDRRADAMALLQRSDSIYLNSDIMGDWPVTNLVTARVREAAGDKTGARRSIERVVVEIFSSPQFQSTYFREQARLELEAGDTVSATRALSRYVALRSDPEPSMRPGVDSARAELSALVGR